MCIIIEDFYKQDTGKQPINCHTEKRKRNYEILMCSLIFEGIEFFEVTIHLFGSFVTL